MLLIAVTSIITISLLWVIPRWPMAIIGLYTCIPFYKNAIDPLLLIDATALLAVLSMAVFGLLIFRHGVIPRVDILFLWGVFLVIVLIGISYSRSEIAVDQGLGFLSLTFLPILPILFIGKTEEYKSQFLVALALVGAVNLTTAIYTLLFGDVLFRLQLSTANTIGVSRSILLIPMILITTRRLRKGWRMYGAIGVSTVSFLIAFSTGSRGALIAAILAIAVALVLDPAFWKRLIYIAIAAAAAIPIMSIPVIAVWTRLPEASIDRIVGFFEILVGSSQDSLDNSSSQRLDLANLAVEMFEQSPLVGHGVGSFFTFASMRDDVVTTDYPHNLVLHLLSELGIVGCILVIGFICYCGLNAIGGITRSPLNLALFAIATDMLVNSMFSNSIYDFRLLWASLIAAACAAPTIYSGQWLPFTRPERKLTFKYKGRPIGLKST